MDVLDHDTSHHIGVVVSSIGCTFPCQAPPRHLSYITSPILFLLSSFIFYPSLVLTFLSFLPVLGSLHPPNLFSPLSLGEPFFVLVS